MMNRLGVTNSKANKLYNQLRFVAALQNYEESRHEMVQLPRIRKRFQKEIEKYNKQLGKTEQIKKLVLMDTEWSLTTGELSPTLKLRRNFINKKYQEVIKKIFDIEEKEE